MKKTFKNEHASVTLYGRFGKLSTQVGKVYELARLHGAETAFIIVPPSSPEEDGWHKVIADDSQYELPVMVAEGGVLKRKQALMISTRDRPVVVITNKKTGAVGAVNAGREQLISRHSPCCFDRGVLERLISALQIDEGSQAEAYITGGIGADYFMHPDQEYVEPFIRLYGNEVVKDPKKGTLDLHRVIKIKLSKYGIHQVFEDGLCTFSTDWLGSRRGQLAGLSQKTQANGVLVVTP